MPIDRSLLCLMGICGLQAALMAQTDTLEAPPWVDREFRHWSGLPMMHGPNGECIAGYTEEESLLYFCADGSFQQITFEDVWNISFIGSYGVSGPCEPLEGDTLSLQTGRWMLIDDTLRVTVERTGLYPYEPFISEFIDRVGDPSFRPSMRPARTCTSRRERWFLFSGDEVVENGRVWH